MFKRQAIKKFSAMLILLLLVDSSFALDVLVHGPVEINANNLVTMSHQDHQSHHGNHQSAMDEGMATEFNDADQDCFCDEICCAGSLNIFQSGAICTAVGNYQNRILLRHLYQSINLDSISRPPR
ncbi:MAG: hypothetical protein RL120_12480 [Gammaproteobacteria bacterium]